MRDYKVTGVQTCALPIYRVLENVLSRELRCHETFDTPASGGSSRFVAAPKARSRCETFSILAPHMSLSQIRRASRTKEHATSLVHSTFASGRYSDDQQAR